MNRKEAREAAFSVLFSFDFNHDEPLDQLWLRAIAEQGYEHDGYAENLLTLCASHLEEIDLTIEKYAVGWKMERISAVSRAILRLAMTEMFYLPEIPLIVSLNEAIELSKRFDDEKAYGFVNGVLNAVKNDVRSVEKK